MLLQFQTDFWKEPTSVGRFVDFKVSKNDVAFMTKLLHHHKLHHDVMIDDVEKLLQRNRERRSVHFEEISFENFEYEIYHPPEEVLLVIERFVTSTNDSIMRTQKG